MDKQKFHILVTSVGRKVWLLRTFKETLNALDLDGKVVAADISPMAPAMYASDKSCQVCRVSEAEYVPQLLELCEREEIDLLVPLIDTELLPLAETRERFAQVGTTVLVSSPEVVRITMDKRLTHRFLMEHGFDTPRIFDLDPELKRSVPSYPVFVKPAMSAASIGATRVDSEAELKVFMKRVEDPILQEYLAGQEYTLDVLADFQGTVRCVVPRKRLAIRAGEVNKAVTVKDRYIMEVGRRVVEALPGAIGPITVQGFQLSDGRFLLTDINPRFGSGVPVALKARADFPKWIVELALGRGPTIPYDEWQDGLLMLRYDEAIFVPSDGTSPL